MEKIKTSKSVRLKFGIDEILNIPGKSFMLHAQERTIAGGQQNFQNYGGDIQKEISHIYGRQPTFPAHVHLFQLYSKSYVEIWNASRDFPMINSPNMEYKHGESMRSLGLQMPSIIQRVPLSVSFRKDSCPNQTAGNPTVAVRSGKRKKTWTRAVFSNLQRKGLERSFTAQQYISKKDRRKLAATLGLTDAQVRIWYANRRMKAKKVHTMNKCEEY